MYQSDNVLKPPAIRNCFSVVEWDPWRVYSKQQDIFQIISLIYAKTDISLVILFFRRRARKFLMADLFSHC